MIVVGIIFEILKHENEKGKKKDKMLARAQKNN
jgi:hypothetical protein